VTEEAAAVAPVWVLDGTCLSHFARAERLDVLRDLLVDKECWTTRVVLEELDKGVAEYPALQGVRAGDWLKVAELGTLDEIQLFASWVGRTGSGERDLGEASVFAAAELHGATAITDDREAVRVARTYGLDVHGTIWLLAGACRDGKLSEPAAGNLIDALRSTGMRLPCTGAEFPDYARRYGLIGGGAGRNTAPIEYGHSASNRTDREKNLPGQVGCRRTLAPHLMRIIASLCCI
jgi:predicted nucleic acid-binding protein